MAEILVIDDEAPIRRFLRSGFELENFSVLEAENAELKSRLEKLERMLNVK